MSVRSLQMTEVLRTYLLRVGIREDAALVKLREETAALPQARMQISPEQGALMAMLVRLTGARRILEVGTFTGYSALAMALALPDDGRIVCLDQSEEWTSIARRHWDAANVGDRIELRLGPAVDTLDALIAEGQAATFDLAFVDADKINLLAYFERALALVRQGAAVLFDNVLWSGSVADPANREPSTEAIRALNEQVRTDPRVDVAMVPIGDGLTIARKR